MKHALSIIQILIFTGLSTSFTVCAQADITFDQLTTKQGLSVNSVSSICQDKEGFMWFGTWYGINKYDGYNFTVSKHDPHNPQNSLRNNAVLYIHEDKKEQLWLGTWRGLHLLDKHSGKITAFLNRGSSNASLGPSVNAIFSIYEDREGYLWLSAFVGFSRFDPNTGKFTNYQLPENAAIYDIVQDNNGKLWLGSSAGLYQFNPVTNRFAHVPLQKERKMQPSVSALYLETGGVLWIGTSDAGLYRMNIEGSAFQPDSYNPAKKINKNINSNAIVADAKDNLWVGTTDGLQRINKKTGGVTTYRFNASQPGSLNSNNVRSIYLDRFGNLWVGTDNGINRVTAQLKPFKTYQFNSAYSNARLFENSVSAVLQDKNDFVWLRTGLGLVKLDSNLKQVAHLAFNPIYPSKQLSDWVRAIYEDRSGRLWIGTPEGLQLLNDRSGKFTVYPFKLSIDYQSIVEDLEGKLWIGSGSGLVSFDPVKKQYTYYTRESSLMGNFLRGAIVSRSGDIWVGSGTRGIFRLNQKKGRFTHYKPNDSSSKNRLNDYDILCLYEDKEGTIWAGTSQGGLNRFDQATNSFSYFTTTEGLPSNNVESIIGDDNGNLWISTNKGISRFNPKTKTFRNFDETDGLPENEFVMQASYKRKGKLFFGSLNGLVMFNPDSIKNNSQVPPVHITAFKIFDKPQLLTNQPIALSYKENFLSFEFVALNYNASGKNQYAYYLEGLERDWVLAGSRRYISYSNLKPGNYTIRVKASNNDNVWNEQGASLKITISPPWWRTWWAYSFYGFCLVAVFVAVDRFQRRRLIQKEREKMRQRELEQAREIERAYQELKITQTQLVQKEKMASLGELTAGIAHEIQNPLNFVNNFSEVSKELCAELKEELSAGHPNEAIVLADDLSQNLNKIHHHGQRADSIVKGMLQHSRTSIGEKQSTDINALADEYLRLSYHGLRSKDKDFNAHLIRNFDKSIGEIKVVPQEIGRVLLNVFNNAFYATQQKKAQLNGQYQPEVKVTTCRLKGQVEIKIRDNGCGIPEEVKHKIFQPFFTTKPTGEGTGLGLSLSYDIITKGHGGVLRVESKEEQFAEFAIYLPL